MSKLRALRTALSRLTSRLAEHRAAAPEEDRGGMPPSPPPYPPPPVYPPAPSYPPPAALPTGQPLESAAVRQGRPDPATMVPWGVRVAAEAGWRLLVLAGVVYVLVRAISTVSLVVLAFAAGLLITALLQPTVARLRRVGVARGPATAITFITGFAALGLVGWFVVWQVMENLDELTRQLQGAIEEMKTWLLNSPFHVTEGQINDIADNLNEWLGSNSQEITTAGLQGVTVVFEFLSGALLAMFVTLFLLYDGRRVWEWSLNFVPRAARPGVAGAGPRAWNTLTGYVRGTVLIAFIDAVFIGLGIYLLGVPMAMPLAVFIFLFSFVPIVGAVVSGALAVLVAFVANGVVNALLVVAVVLLVQQIEGNVLQPFILGRMVRVHPLGVVLAVTGGSLIAGIPGAVVAVPLVAVANTVVGYLRRHAAVDVAGAGLAGRGGDAAVGAVALPRSDEREGGEEARGEDGR